MVFSILDKDGVKVKTVLSTLPVVVTRRLATSKQQKKIKALKCKHLTHFTIVEEFTVSNLLLNRRNISS